MGEDKVVFEKEYLIQEPDFSNEPYTVSKEEDGTFRIEGPRVERMLGYTNLDSEKGFEFFQKFLKNNGMLEELEALGIEDGDTVEIYGWSFEYYR
jgi:GTP-binding protein